MTTADERQAASARIADLLDLFKQQQGPDIPSILAECEALSRAVNAFHMEGIRFRIYNLDRLMTRNTASLPPAARTLLEETRRHLETAGFHTRSHQSPV